MPPAFAKDLRELTSFALNAALMSAIALAVFWFWPTAVPIFPIDGVMHPALHFLKTTDAVPAMRSRRCTCRSRCTRAGFFARQLREVGAPAWARALNVVWAVGIVYSTMAVRQHVLIDVAGGLLLGGASSASRLESSSQIVPAAPVLPA